MKPIRLRDFIEDTGGCLYAVSAYDNGSAVGCVLRYVPDPAGERVAPDGRRFTKYDFEEAYAWIAEHKPQYEGLIQRVPHADIRRVYKPEEEIISIAAGDPRVQRLLDVFGVPDGHAGCTGSLLCGLGNEGSDIDMVVYGDWWFAAQENLRRAIETGDVLGLSEEMWRKVYAKRVPEIPYETFVLHERRKWNRGEIDGTYFDLLYTRSYDNLAAVSAGRGTVLGRATIEATVTDASLAFDSPAVYDVSHERVAKVLSFTHTYSGQALAGETIEARGVLEQHGAEVWLIVGTTREAKGEYIVSRTLMEQG
ncbi:MAG: DNA polymerase subunit beta [Methanomicrobiales archaeon]|nr:DNA polymerase subunit beta [Methanomicrobiales archaeon]